MQPQHILDESCQLPIAPDSPQRSRRFQTRHWPDFIAIALAIFYLLFTLGVLQTRGLFDYLGVDYVSFRAAAAVVQENGFGDLYDLALQERFQRQLFEAYATGPYHGAFVTAPMVYLPPFVLLFMPLLLFAPVTGLIVWNVLNLVLLGVYLGRFIKAVGLPPRSRIWFYVLVSAPVFGTWLAGQVSVWLLITLGEFILASRRGKPFLAGLWLAGLLLKPQALILLLPALLLGRQWKGLAGLTTAGLAVLALSLPLVGGAGLVQLGQLLVGFAGGMASTNPFMMTNWRSLAVHMELVIPAAWAWGIAWAGMALTAGAALTMWRRPGPPDSPQFARALLGTYAATCAIAWHAHVHMALPLLAPLLLLQAQDRLPRRLANVWLLAPAAIFPLAFLTLPALAHNLVGLSLLLLNLGLLAWAVGNAWHVPGDD